MVYGRYFYFSFAFVTLLMGGFIYIHFRDANILFLTWLRYLNIDYSSIRQINQINSIIMNKIIYNLPNGLWVLSGLLFLNTFSENKILLKDYSIIFITICMSYEIGQHFNVIPGTFDIFDIIAIIIFSGIGLLANILWRKHEKN